MNNQITLKPYPFCGYDNIRISGSIYLRDPMITLYAIRCSRCNATVGEHFITKEAAAEAWNRRAGDPDAAVNP